MVNDDVARPDLPFATSAAAIYLTKQIDALDGVKTQRLIAKEMGYDKPNILSMFKTGASKIPIDRVPSMASALHVSPGHLLRLVMEQHYPSLAATFKSVFGEIISPNERDLLGLWREATENADPAPTIEPIERLRERVGRGSAAP